MRRRAGLCGIDHDSETSPEEPQQNITIIVEDSGPGVRDELKDMIFDRFFTSRRGSAEEENSSGLGLYICKQIVEAHRGKIAVTDRKGGGAAFIISL